MKDFYGLQEGIVGYFGVGIKYDAAPVKKEQKPQEPAQDAAFPTMPTERNIPMPTEGTMIPGVQQ